MIPVTPDGFDTSARACASALAASRTVLPVLAPDMVDRPSDGIGAAGVARPAGRPLVTTANA